MKEQLINHFNTYDYDYNHINFSSNIDNIAIQVENDLLEKPYSVDVSRKIMVGVWQIQNKLKREDLKNNEFRSMFGKIETFGNYSIDDRFIICTKFIPCSAIKVNDVFYILDKNQISKLTQLGYGVTSFKIPIDKTIRNIYCTGKHPNLNISSNAFCVGSDMGIDLTIENLSIVEYMLGQFNLSSCYLDQKEYSEIWGVLQKCQTKIPLY